MGAAFEPGFAPSAVSVAREDGCFVVRQGDLVRRYPTVTAAHRLAQALAGWTDPRGVPDETAGFAHRPRRTG